MECLGWNLRSCEPVAQTSFDLVSPLYSVGAPPIDKDLQRRGGFVQQALVQGEKKVSHVQ